MNSPRISESEWEVMTVVWGSGPAPASDIVAILAERKGWHSRTTRTLIDRLVKKKVLQVDTAGPRNLYMARMAMEDAVRQESQSFINRVFSGEPAAMLMHFVGQAKLSKKDIQKLKDMLAQKEK